MNPCHGRRILRFLRDAIETRILIFMRRISYAITCMPSKHNINNIHVAGCYLTIGRLNRKHCSRSCKITPLFRDKDKSLWELIPNTSSRRFASRLRNAETPTRFVMQKWICSDNQLWSGTVILSQSRCFLGIFQLLEYRRRGDGNYRAVRKSVLSARLDSFEKPAIIKQRRTPAS